LNNKKLRKAKEEEAEEIVCFRSRARETEHLWAQVEGKAGVEEIMCGERV
jgi:hypothetical protein